MANQSTHYKLISLANQSGSDPGGAVVKPTANGAFRYWFYIYVPAPTQSGMVKVE